LVLGRRGRGGTVICVLTLILEMAVPGHFSEGLSVVATPPGCNPLRDPLQDTDIPVPVKNHILRLGDVVVDGMTRC